MAGYINVLDFSGLQRVRGYGEDYCATMQQNLDEVTSLTGTGHHIVQKLRQEVAMFQSYVTHDLPARIARVRDEADTQTEVQDWQRDLDYDVSSVKRMHFYLALEQFAANCMNRITKEYRILAQALGNYPESNILPNLLARSAKLGSQLDSMEDKLKGLRASDSLPDEPDVQGFIDNLLIFHRNLKMLKFKMTRSTAPSSLEQYLHRTLLDKSYFMTKPIGSKLPVRARVVKRVSPVKVLPPPVKWVPKPRKEPRLGKTYSPNTVRERTAAVYVPKKMWKAPLPPEAFGVASPHVPLERRPSPPRPTAWKIQPKVIGPFASRIPKLG